MRADSENDGKVILIIEDDEGIRSALNKLLSREGYTVVEASHGREGIEILEG